MSINPFKSFNVFTLLITVFVFAVVLRLVNIANFSVQTSVAESTAPEQNFKKIPEQPPLPTKKDDSETKENPKTKTKAKKFPYEGERAFSTAELKVLQSLSKRRDTLDKREKKIRQHEALLKAAEGEVDRKVAELNKIKSELEDLLNKQQVIQDERLDSLVKIYENMKPKLAARIFDTLEMEVLLSVISRMKERKSSPILANMNPEKARQVTIQLAEQRKLPGLSSSTKKIKHPL